MYQQLSITRRESEWRRQTASGRESDRRRLWTGSALPGSLDLQSTRLSGSFQNFHHAVPRGGENMLSNMATLFAQVIETNLVRVWICGDARARH